MSNSEHTLDREDAAEPAFLDVVLPRTPACAASARQLMSNAMGSRMSPPALERTMLATSELVTNAWKHGEGTITLKAAHRPGAVRIEVIDEGSGAVPEIRPVDGDSSGGWGLRIVDEVALSWGCFEGTTHVWADLPLT